MIRRPPRTTRTDTLFPDTTLFRSRIQACDQDDVEVENTLLALNMFGIPCAFSLWLQQDGADVDWQAAIFPLDGDTALAGTATIAGETLGRITRISLGVPGVDFEGSTFGHVFILNDDVQRSEERRVGKECVRTCRSRGAP